MRVQSQKVDCQKFNYEAAVTMYHEKRGESGLKMPKVFAAVKNECKGAETDSGDSEDLDGSDAFEDDSEGSMLMVSSDDEIEQNEGVNEGLAGVDLLDSEDEAFIKEMAHAGQHRWIRLNSNCQWFQHQARKHTNPEEKINPCLFQAAPGQWQVTQKNLGAQPPEFSLKIRGGLLENGGPGQPCQWIPAIHM